MPLSETNKKQSQSIEDLIAQLDIPATNSNNNPQQQSPENGSDKSNTVNNNQQSTTAAAAAAAAAAARRQMKGRRTYSTSSSGYNTGSFSSSNGTTTTTTYSFSKQPSFGQSAEPVLHKNAITSKKYSKKLGRLRNCGAPKKDGAGGKHTWGAPGCELQADDYLDSKDPNYDSEEAGNVVMVCTEAKAKAKADGEDPSSENEDEDQLGRSHGQAKKQLLDTDDLDAEIKPIILEYFQNGDTIEVITLIKKYSLPSRVRPTLVAYLVQLALENNNTSKELISRLLRDLSFEVIASEQDYVLGFDLLLKNLPDLTLDNPDAPEKTGTFIARAIADRILARNYLDSSVNGVDASNDKVSKAIESARLLVTMNDHLYHLSHIWGNKGGFLAVQELTDKINEIIQEYHDSADCNEAIRCLKELNVPHFHHEFVFEAIDFALQKGSDQSIELITELLYRLCQSVIITYDQLKMGILRIFDILPDIRLDVPNANSLMEKILKKCQSKGFVTENILDSALNKSRKRFVSEGDGGKIKENGL